MEKTAEATLADGRKLPYIVTDNPPRGGMKYTYFAPDKSYVIQFFNEPSKIDRSMRARLEAIIGRYNPTVPESAGGAIGNDERLASYFAARFCWPTDLVVEPEFGIVSPAYPKSFFFDENASQFLDLKGKDKKSNWFTSGNRRYLSKSELGDFRSMAQMSLLLARSIRRLHQAGLAHSDLSNNNVLIDPKSGNCVVIDIDSLVVPGLFPPEVAGTRGYIAPEVLATMELDRSDPRRMIPSSSTDLHALAVLIYEYLFCRHPLMGPKIFSAESAEKDDLLGLGEMALFIENPNDTSNRPPNLKNTIKDLGPILENLFIRAFVDGLHNPPLRPSAMEWERGLVKTWDLLHKCANPRCDKKWFVLHDVNNPVCPFCGTRAGEKNIVRFEIYSEVRGHTGEWRKFSELDIVHNTPLFKWHLQSSVFADEKADKSLQAYACCHGGNWFIINCRAQGLLSPSGNPVPAGQAIRIEDGTQFRACCGERGTLIRVRIY
ncbi:MAG: serine/threonine-protein kinase [Ruminococcus sp.]|nr:serine/threonine-protein kinase [Ruminococcus sp.]MCM1382043.1 serine/threonine-protein kinase [Muribaculaceae bacterium]MCM1478924.1 serine/threonine-protein kinase [Muribaculaceae bacterium]